MSIAEWRISKTSPRLAEPGRAVTNPVDDKGFPPTSIVELLPQVRDLLPLSDIDALNRLAATLCDVIESVLAAPVHGSDASAEMRLTVAARREAAVKLTKSGMSRRQAAKVLGVSPQTVSNDLTESVQRLDARDKKEAEEAASLVGAG
jgi:DNA-binding CsgD family transcriptional regulator